MQIQKMEAAEMSEGPGRKFRKMTVLYYSLGSKKKLPFPEKADLSPVSHRRPTKKTVSSKNSPSRYKIGPHINDAMSSASFQTDDFHGQSHYCECEPTRCRLPITIRHTLHNPLPLYSIEGASSDESHLSFFPAIGMPILQGHNVAHLAGAKLIAK